MKSYRKLAVIVSVLFPVLLVCTNLLADEKTAEESKQANWGWAHNEGNVDVILHVKMDGDRYTDLILPAGGKMILPKGTVKVKVISMKLSLEETDNLEVDIRPAYYAPNVGWPRITESGKSRTFSEPTTAIPIKERSYLDADVIVPPGASEPTPERALPSDWESPDEPKREPEQVSKADRKSRLLKLNESYTKLSKRLAEVAPDSEEAKQIRKALREHGRLIDKYIDEEIAERGPDWIETYRGKTGKLPGGLIEDTKSKLIKLKEDTEKQKEKSAELEKDFERLKKEKPVPSWKEYLDKKRDELKEEFVKEYGPSSEWDKKGNNIRADYQKKYNELRDKAKEEWDKEKEAESENNRKLGKIIKRLAEERIKLEELEEGVRYLEKEVAEEERVKEEEAAKERQAEKRVETSALNGNWRGDAFEWDKVAINNGKGTSSFGHFEVQREKFVYKNGDHTREYEFSGTWWKSSGDWSGLIGLHLYNDNQINVIWETPIGRMATDHFLRISPPPIKKDLPKED